MNQTSLKLAHDKFPRFCEYVLRDESKNPPSPIRLSPIHELAIRFVEYVFAIGKYAVVCLPWGHGKSSIFSVGFPLWRWGKVNVNETIFLVSGTDNMVKTRIQSIQGHIEGRHDDSLSRIFPNVIADKKSSWQKSQIDIQRDFSGMPSLSAYSVLATGEGGRCGLLILDDVVTLANSVIKNQSQQIIDAVENTWLRRIHPGGHALLLNTPWTTTDLISHIQRSRLDRWAVLRVAVNKSLSALDVTVLGDDPARPFQYSPSCPLWGERFDAMRLQKEYQTGPRSFRRGYQLDPYSEAERKLPHFGAAVAAGIGITIRSMMGRAPRYSAVLAIDPGGSSRPGTGMVVMGSMGGKRLMFHVEAGQWTPTEVAQRVIANYLQWHPQLVVLENNALQTAFIDLIRAMNGPVMPLVGFQTGAKKSDPTIGIEGMDAEFARGDWVIPAGEFESHEIGCPCHWCRWQLEMTNFPNYPTSDLVMPTWFCWEYLRRIGGDGGIGAATYGDLRAGDFDSTPATMDSRGASAPDEDEEESDMPDRYARRRS